MGQVAKRADRPKRVRMAADALSQHFQVKFTAEYSAPNWGLWWSDGPCYEPVKRRLGKLDVADVTFTMYRGHSVRALALAALRVAMSPDAELSSWMGQHDLTDGLFGVEYPERAVDDREEWMVTRLLAEATPPGWNWPDDQLVLSLVRERGPGWFLAAAGADGSEPLLSPLEVLTTIYATGTHERDWRLYARPMPAEVAIATATTDTKLTSRAALAVLRLLAERRREHERAVAAAVEAARRSGADAASIADALGVTAAALAVPAESAG